MREERGCGREGDEDEVVREIKSGMERERRDK